MSDAPDSEQFMARVEALLARGDVPLAEGAPLSSLGAGIVVAVEMGLSDSRAFSRALGVEHALVLREIALLSGPDGLLAITGRNPKTLRTSLELTARGAGLLKECCGPLLGRQDGAAA